MKNNFIKTAVCLFSFIFLMGCSEEEVLPDTPIVGLGGDTWAKGEIDNYIKTNFTDSYNIEVKYKWDPYEVNFNKNLTPVMENKVMPALDAVLKIWMAPYEKVIGKPFLRKFSPRQFVLVGSAEYNSDGTIVLGQAEGGKKITLLVINDFDKKDETEVKRMLHTIHHEFAHILHQNILYQREFKQLNPEWYTATWFNSSIADANAQGLVTDYAKASADEDFVETISYLLVEGQAAFDAMVNANPGKAATILRQKEAMVVAYFNNAYQIDFRALQAETQKGIAEITR